ncbi:helical backbone metal receptor [Pedobacter sp. PWIIR3]
MQRSFTDQLGNSISISYPPKRIISLVPSQTELLFELGMDKEIVGLTKFCIHPIEKFARCVKVGGTKKLNIELIRSLQPDLIIGNKEENQQNDIEELMREFPVWISDVNDLDGAMAMIAKVGALVDREPEASYLNHLINAGFTDLQTLAAQYGINKTVAYLIWKDPYLFVGKDTFIDHLLTVNGLNNVFKQSRYPESKLEDLVLLEPDLIFLSSEPYPFKKQHLEEIQKFLPESKVVLVDGEMFSWYGSRLVKAVQYFFEFQKKISVI